MERSRVTLISLICVLFSSISGIVVEMRVKPGDDVTIYGNCEWKTGFKIAWLRIASHEHRSPLIYLPEDLMHPRYSLVRNNTNRTFDLLLKNITESDLGLYYCVLHKKDKSGDGFQKEGCYYGSRTTFLSFLDTTRPCADFPQTTPISVCWKLLVSVCPVCVLLSSTCVYCICRYTAKADRRADRRENMKMRKRNEAGDDDVCYASLDVLSSRQKRLRNAGTESSDLCTYSEVKFEKI